jgi:hypothetical protein
LTVELTTETKPLLIVFGLLTCTVADPESTVKPEESAVFSVKPEVN